MGDGYDDNDNVYLLFHMLNAQSPILNTFKMMIEEPCQPESHVSPDGFFSTDVTSVSTGN